MEMKLVVVTLVVIIFVKCSYIDSKSSPILSDPNIFRCKICSEMVDADFNYDHIMSNADKLSKIKNYFLNQLGIEESQVNEQLSKDNLEFMTKEISMQYFFKGSESSIGANSKECKAVESEKCDKLKNKLCENVLGLNEDDCRIKFRIRDPSKSKISGFANQNNLRSNSNLEKSIDLMEIISKNAKSPIGLDKNSIEDAGNTISKMNSPQLKHFSSKPINNPPKFRQINGLENDYNIHEDASQFNNMSLLDVSTSQLTIPSLPDPHDVHEDIKKTFWTPPKPVLLDNFQNNLGTQLKDISILTTEITKLESKLKILKQELANKIEIAQSSYVAIQKTLTEISKLVNNQPQQNIINTKTDSSVIEDDWDENSKPKFLNKLG